MKQIFNIIILVLVVFVGTTRNKVFAADPIEEYAKAWKEQNSEFRLKLIRTFWTEQSVYQDPAGIAKGPEELNELIGKFYKSFPGATIKPLPILVTGNFRGAGWQIYDASQKLVISGHDFIELDGKGKITKLIGFFVQ